MATVTLRLTPQRAHVRTARLVAAAMARRSGVAEELLDEIRLAVGEACGRAVQLHERYGMRDPVVVTLTDDDRYEIVVQDAAPPKGDGLDADLDPGNGAQGGRPAADRPGARRHASVLGWEEPLDTGLGLALLDALVEDITVETTADPPGTRVHMSWPIDRPTGDGADDGLASSPAG